MREVLLHESEQKREWNGSAFDGRISGKKTSVDSTAKRTKKLRPEEMTEDTVIELAQLMYM